MDDITITNSIQDGATHDGTTQNDVIDIEITKDKLLYNVPILIQDDKINQDMEKEKSSQDIAKGKISQDAEKQNAEKQNETKQNEITQDAEEKTFQDTEEKTSKDAEEKTSQDAEEKTSQDAEEKTSQDAEEKTFQAKHDEEKQNVEATHDEEKQNIEATHDEEKQNIEITQNEITQDEITQDAAKQDAEEKTSQDGTKQNEITQDAEEKTSQDAAKQDVDNDLLQIPQISNQHIYETKLQIVLKSPKDIKKLEEENKKFEEENKKLKEENKKFEEENKKLKEENKKLEEENMILKENKELKAALTNKNDTIIDKRIYAVEVFQEHANKQLDIINQNNLNMLYSNIRIEKGLFILNVENDNPNPKIISDDIKTINLNDAELYTSFDANRVSKKRGKLIMVFSNYKKRKQDARENFNRFWYSKTFLTHQGYKICARIYPHGDGNGNVGNYLSFFFMIVKTSNDDKLDWPFKHKIELKLFNQTGIKSDISDEIFPDNCISYQQPTELTNPGHGCPKFVPHNIFINKDYGYLVDDKIILSISVDDKI